MLNAITSMSVRIAMSVNNELAFLRHTFDQIYSVVCHIKILLQSETYRALIIMQRFSTKVLTITSTGTRNIFYRLWVIATTFSVCMVISISRALILLKIHYYNMYFFNVCLCYYFWIFFTWTIFKTELILNKLNEYPLWLYWRLRNLNSVMAGLILDGWLFNWVFTML